MNPEFSIIIPIYNEQENIHKLYDRLKSVMNGMNVSHEFVFVNDGSRDRSMILIRRVCLWLTI